MVKLSAEFLMPLTPHRRRSCAPCVGPCVDAPWVHYCTLMHQGTCLHDAALSYRSRYDCSFLGSPWHLSEASIAHVTPKCIERPRCGEPTFWDTSSLLGVPSADFQRDHPIFLWIIHKKIVPQTGVELASLTCLVTARWQQSLMAGLWVVSMHSALNYIPSRMFSVFYFWSV